MRTMLKSKANTKYVFRYCSSSKRTSQETEVRFNRVIKSRLSVRLVDFDPFCLFLFFQGSFALAIIMIDGSENVFRCSRSRSR